MYHPSIIEKRVAAEEKRLGYKLVRHTPEECISAANYLDTIYDPVKGVTTRKLTKEEHRWIDTERILCTLDFPYFCPRYAYLVDTESKRVPLRFWEAQAVAFEKIAQGEVDAWKWKRSNIWAWLKARRLGATQIAGTMILHRNNFYPNEMGIVASDKPKSSLELFRRIQYTYNYIPWWLKAHKGAEVKGDEIFFDKLNSIIRYGHGDTKGGGLAQGSRTSIFHLSEVATWENWQQLDEDFLPTVPRNPTTTGFLESTAKRRDDFWHQIFTEAWEGNHPRVKALFIPWYTEVNTYTAVPPDDWKPSELTLAHTAKVLKQSPMYCNGRTVRLTRGQQFWYESEYNSHLRRGALNVFLSEYCSDHFEAFQNAGSNLFSAELINELRNKAGAVPPMAFDLIGL